MSRTVRTNHEFFSQSSKKLALQHTGKHNGRTRASSDHLVGTFYVQTPQASTFVDPPYFCSSSLTSLTD